MTPALYKSRCACEGSAPGTTIDPFSFLSVHDKSDRLKICAEASSDSCSATKGASDESSIDITDRGRYDRNCSSTHTLYLSNCGQRL